MYQRKLYPAAGAGQAGPSGWTAGGAAGETTGPGPERAARVQMRLAGFRLAGPA